MTISINLAGCIDDPQACEEQICRLLEEKYGESFEIAAYYGRDRVEDCCNALVVSQAHPDVLFEAQAACDGSYLIDEYVAARVCSKMEEQITEKLDELPGYTVVKVEAVSMNIDTADAEMSPEDFMATKTKNLFVVYLHDCPADGKAKELSLLEGAFGGMPYLNGFLEYYVMDEEILKRVQSYLEESARTDYEYEQILQDVKKVRIPIKNGRLENNEEAGER